MRISFVIGLLFLMNLSGYSQHTKAIKKKEISFEVNSTIQINDCIKWHIDFSKLKSTVLYKNHFISMGIYGGFVAIDTGFSKVNTQYSQKLNADLYTNLAVRHDTLFAEKFKKIYFLSEKDTSWIPYRLNEPIVLFNILFEDEKYVFFPITQGEFGTMLFIYDKGIRKLRVVSYGDNPGCIYYQDGAYYINASLWHLRGSSTFRRLHNIDNLNVIPEDQSRNPLLNLQSHFLRLPVTEYPYTPFDPRVGKDVMKNIITIDYGVMVNNSFKINNRYYHFTDFNNLPQKMSHDKTYITEIVDEELEIVDSINSFCAVRTKIYDKYTIIESNNVDEGYYISNNDCLHYISFRGTPDYDLRFRDTSVLVNNHLITSKIYRETYSREPDFKRNFSASLGSNISINSFGNNDHRELYFQTNKDKSKIILNSEWNVLNTAFEYNDNWFIYFFNLGNFDHKYGLIEIYDLERFIKKYSKSLASG